MKTYIHLLFLLLITSCLKGQVEYAADHQSFENYNITANQADTIFKNVKKVSNQTQIAIALIENGTAKFYGIKRAHDSIHSVTNYENVFEIGSISKVFTSTLLAGLVLDQKIVSLDDSIDLYLKYAFKDGQKLSFKDLANHTSGLPRLPTNLI